MSEVVEGLIFWKAVLVVAWLAAFFVAERVMPAARPPLTKQAARHRLGRNGGLWLLNFALSPLIILPLSAFASTQSLGWRPSGSVSLWTVLLDVLVLDFLIYWWHRANHVVPFLWRFHEVHHLDSFLDTTTALRFHFGEVLLSAMVRAVIVILLDIPLVSIVVFETVVLMAALFHHSNLRLPAGLEHLLARIIITPSIHWVHHHAVRRDTDSNYGTLLSLWDRLFASRSPHPRLLDMPIGVEGRGHDRKFLDLLIWPARRQG